MNITIQNAEATVTCRTHAGKIRREEEKVNGTVSSDRDTD